VKAGGLEAKIATMPLPKEGYNPKKLLESTAQSLEIMLKAQESGRAGVSLNIETVFDPPQFQALETSEAAHLRHDPTRGES